MAGCLTLRQEFGSEEIKQLAIIVLASAELTWVVWLNLNSLSVQGGSRFR